MHTTLLQRLSFARYLFQIASEQSKLPELQSAASVLMFHDAVELFLQIASEHLNTGKQQPNFLDYWDFLAPKIGSELPQKESMRRLNKARVAMKHGGTLPSKMDIESFRFSTLTFFQEATPIIFNRSFSELSLITFVSDIKAREHLTLTQKHLAEGKYLESAAEVHKAFRTVVYHGTLNEDSDGNRPFRIGRDMTFLSANSLGLRDPEFRKAADFVDATRDTLRDLQDTVLLLALGIDHRRYRRFKSKLPNVTQTLGGSWCVDIDSRKIYDVTDKEYIEWCIDFVVEIAITLRPVITH